MIQMNPFAMKDSDIKNKHVNMVRGRGKMNWENAIDIYNTVCRIDS